MFTKILVYIFMVAAANAFPPQWNTDKIMQNNFYGIGLSSPIEHPRTFHQKALDQALHALARQISTHVTGTQKLESSEINGIHNNSYSESATTQSSVTLSNYHIQGEHRTESEYWILVTLNKEKHFENILANHKKQILLVRSKLNLLKASLKKRNLTLAVQTFLEAERELNKLDPLNIRELWELDKNLLYELTFWGDSLNQLMQNTEIHIQTSLNLNSDNSLYTTGLPVLGITLIDKTDNLPWIGPLFFEIHLPGHRAPILIEQRRGKLITLKPNMTNLTGGRWSFQWLPHPKLKNSQYLPLVTGKPIEVAIPMNTLPNFVFSLGAGWEQFTEESRQRTLAYLNSGPKKTNTQSHIRITVNLPHYQQTNLHGMYFTRITLQFENVSEVPNDFPQIPKKIESQAGHSNIDHSFSLCLKKIKSEWQKEVSIQLLSSMLLRLQQPAPKNLSDSN